MSHLTLRGTSRDAEDARRLVLALSRAPTDDELRAMHEAISLALRPSPAPDEAG